MPDEEPDAEPGLYIWATERASCNKCLWQRRKNQGKIKDPEGVLVILAKEEKIKGRDLPQRP